MRPLILPVLKDTVHSVVSQFRSLKSRHLRSYTFEGCQIHELNSARIATVTSLLAADETRKIFPVTNVIKSRREASMLPITFATATSPHRPAHFPQTEMSEETCRLFGGRRWRLMDGESRTKFSSQRLAASGTRVRSIRHVVSLRKTRVRAANSTAIAVRSTFTFGGEVVVTGPTSSRQRRS